MIALTPLGVINETDDEVSRVIWASSSAWRSAAR